MSRQIVRVNDRADALSRAFRAPTALALATYWSAASPWLVGGVPLAAYSHSAGGAAGRASRQRPRIAGPGRFIVPLRRHVRPAGRPDSARRGETSGAVTGVRRYGMGDGG